MSRSHLHVEAGWDSDHPVIEMWTGRMFDWLMEAFLWSTFSTVGWLRICVAFCELCLIFDLCVQSLLTPHCLMNKTHFTFYWYMSFITKETQTLSWLTKGLILIGLTSLLVKLDHTSNYASAILFHPGLNKKFPL